MTGGGKHSIRRFKAVVIQCLIFIFFLVVCTARCNRLGGNERATSRKTATDEQTPNTRPHGRVLGQRSSGAILYWLLKQELEQELVQLLLSSFR